MWHNNNNNNNDDDDDVSFDMRNALFVQTCSFSDIFVWHDCNVAPHHFGVCVCVFLKRSCWILSRRILFLPFWILSRRGSIFFLIKNTKCFLYKVVPEKCQSDIGYIFVEM